MKRRFKKVIAITMAVVILTVCNVSALTIDDTVSGVALSYDHQLLIIKEQYSNQLDSTSLNGVINKLLEDSWLRSLYSEDPSYALETIYKRMDQLADIMAQQELQESLSSPQGGVYPNYSTAVSPVCQKNGYYCGPAAAVQALIGAGVYTYGLAHTAYDAAQDVIAQLAGTSNSGTAEPGKLAKAMNSKLRGAYGDTTLQYNESITYISATMNSYTVNTLLIGNSIHQNRPCVICVDLQDLPYYTGTSTGRHFITIRAINASTGTAVIVDPFNNSAYRGEHTITYSQLRNMIDDEWLIHAS